MMKHTNEQASSSIDTTPKQALCKCCGKPMEASTPAQPAPTMPAQATPPTKTYESWRDRDPLL